jgi:gamma-glutamyl-gamma-aminobutyrate hydrolase PuuD
MTKIIGLTMRVDKTLFGEKRLGIDSNWINLLNGLGFTISLLPLSNEPAALMLERVKPNAIILTGGNDVLSCGETYSPERNAFEINLLQSLENTDKPVLGVCRGMQIMNIREGGSVEAIEGHVANSHTITWNDEKVNVNSYHNFGIQPSCLSKSFIAEAFDEDGNVEFPPHKK